MRFCLKWLFFTLFSVAAISVVFHHYRRKYQETREMEPAIPKVICMQNQEQEDQRMEPDLAMVTIAATHNEEFSLSPFPETPEDQRMEPNLATDTKTATHNEESSLSPSPETPGDQRMEPLIATDTITALDNQTLIISPYYDPREGQSVRVISIIHVSVKEVYCIFHCFPDQKISVRAKIDIHRDRFDFPYGTADLLCASPSECEYKYMSFQSPNSTNTTQNILFEVRNRPLPPISSNFTICMPTLYGGFTNVLQTVQSFEMYKILGVSKVTIYNTSCSQHVDKVLRHYVDEGFVEVVPWPIDHYLKTSRDWRYVKGVTSEIGYHGQTATINDCLYRNMYKSRYILFNDIDEIVFPIKDKDMTSLMQHLQKQYPSIIIFRVESHLFRTIVNASGFDLWPHIPGNNLLRHPFREPIDKKLSNPRKMIVDPRKVFQLSIHWPLESMGTFVNVTQDMAMIFHGRPFLRRDLTTEDLIRDDILCNYNVSLVPNVDEVIQKLFPRP